MSGFVNVILLSRMGQSEVHKNVSIVIMKGYSCTFELV